MSGTYIMVGNKRRRTDRLNSRVPEGKLREMYVFCLKEGIDPTDMAKDGIQARYYRLKRIAKGTDEGPNIPEEPRVGPVNISVGGKDVAATG